MDLNNVLNMVNSTDLSKVETAFPVLAPGAVKATIAECGWAEDEKNGEKKAYLNVKFTLAQDWKTQPVDGHPSRPIKAGFPFTQRIYIGTYEDKKTGETKPYGIDTLAKLDEAVFGKARPQFEPTGLIGQTLTAKLKFDAAPKNKNTGETYGPSTTVDGYIKPAPVKQGA